MYAMLTNHTRMWSNIIESMEKKTVNMAGEFLFTVNHASRYPARQSNAHISINTVYHIFPEMDGPV